MLFNTWLYAFFLGAVFVLYWSLPFPRLRPWLLIAAGVAFYTNWFPSHTPLILCLTLFTYALGEAIARRRNLSRVLLAIGLTTTVGGLAYYKYAGFFLATLQDLAPGLPVANVAEYRAIRAPLAISFFTFEFVHYLVEVYRGTVRAGFRDFLLFILFFPTLVSGPIKRYQNFEKYLDFARRIDWAEAGQGLERILFGLSKKIIVADTIAVLTAPVWDAPLEHGPGALWLASYGYAIQIYMDFSGYSDIAIGSAKLLGFRVEENFNWPYLRTNIRDFWRSWHMSLTSWITDYLYIPLGGNRGGPRRAAVNTMMAMGICGLWHGAAAHFVAWGLYHGAALCIYREYAAFRDRRGGYFSGRFVRFRQALAGVFTFHVVVIGWVFFVVDTAVAVEVIGRMLALSAGKLG